MGKCEICGWAENVSLHKVYRNKSGWKAAREISICHSCFNSFINNDVEGIVVPAYIPVEQSIKYITMRIAKRNKGVA
jgi:hypothetical protein